MTSSSREYESVKPIQFVTALLLLATLFNPASAQQSVPLKLEIHNDSTPRSSGPMPLDIELTWGGTSLLEGRLVLTFRDGPMFQGRAVSHDMALNVGRNRFRLLLPTLDGKYITNGVDVGAKFVTEKAEIELETRPLRVPPTGGRTFRILYCDPIVRGSDRTVSNLIRSLSFERFWQPSESDQNPAMTMRPNIGTLADVFAPDDMPQDPHWFCSQDMVILSQSGFTGLRTKQLEALSQWVRAGGPAGV